MKYVQTKSFKEEIDSLHLCKQQPSKKGTTTRNSSINKLDPILDDGLLASRTTAKISAQPHAKHLIILPKKNHSNNLIISHCHLVCGHSGLEHTLSFVRQKYWIVNRRDSARGIINDFFICRRRQAPAM